MHGVHNTAPTEGPLLSAEILISLTPAADTVAATTPKSGVHGPRPPIAVAVGLLLLATQKRKNGTFALESS